MMVFASSDKGGTGRSVTSCNLAYRISLLGYDVAYLDFDFGSPTAGAIFEISNLERGAEEGGLHSYILGRVTKPMRVDIRTVTKRADMRTRPPGSGKLMLYPGDVGGAEFALTKPHIKRAIALFEQVEREFDVCIVDLSAGRSSALDMSLQAVSPNVRPRSADPVRWLLFHRWSTQHVIAASGLLFEKNGIVSCAVNAGFKASDFTDLVRTIRTAVPDSTVAGNEVAPEREAWLRESDAVLKDLAKTRHLGQDLLAGTTPLEPMLLWREQVIMDVDVKHNLAKQATTDAFDKLAHKVINNHAWEGF
ncbi:SCO2523 family variant P-loop protein [Catenulispora rubra]|uniref:SCO2523 family variant P-loop protein n=1 Tax=Catenulispora rubra TaxID=280293 RepID=UPI001892355C|nr:SCO2523 family variant P-loop protein [Catenulispora rubra]